MAAGTPHAASRVAWRRWLLAGPRGGADIPVDAHGFVLSRTTHLPGGLHTAVHDVTADEFFSIFEEACLELRREPRGIFARALPPAASGYGGGTRAGEARHHPGRFCARIAPAGTHEQR